MNLRPASVSVSILLALVVTLAACGGGSAEATLTDSELMEGLQDRSFRQFDPSVDASMRKGVILQFSRQQLSLWAQYAVDGHAVSEWEITAEDYRIERSGNDSEVTIHLNDPRSTQEFPTKCTDCVQTRGLSISIRDVRDSEKIAFRINDPHNVLPPPFPVFGSWTRFSEDVRIYGSVILSPAQPVVGAAVTTRLTDPDGVTTDVSWQWAWSTAASGAWTDTSERGAEDFGGYTLLDKVRSGPIYLTDSDILASGAS